MNLSSTKTCFVITLMCLTSASGRAQEKQLEDGSSFQLSDETFENIWSIPPEKLFELQKPVDYQMSLSDGRLKRRTGTIEKANESLLLSPDSSIAVGVSSGPQCLVSFELAFPEKSENEFQIELCFVSTTISNLFSSDALATAEPILVSLELNKDEILHSSAWIANKEGERVKLIRESEFNFPAKSKERLRFDVFFNASMTEVWHDNQLVFCGWTFQHPADLTKVLIAARNHRIAIASVRTRNSGSSAPLSILDKASLASLGARSVLARQLHDNGRFSEAASLHKGIPQGVEQILGQRHVYTSRAYWEASTIQLSLGSYANARQYSSQMQACTRLVVGERHPDYAESLASLALAYSFLADYPKAELLSLQGKAILKNAVGAEHLLYAESLNNLAGLYLSMADYTKAEPLYLEAKSIREKVLGKEHRDYATSLNNLATLYTRMTDYTEAEPLYLEAKSIREQVLGKKHPDYADSLNNLAMLYSWMADYAKAEPLYLEAKSIRENVFAKEHPDYATSLNNLATLYTRMTDYTKAEQLYLEAKSIREKVFGKEHPVYADSLSNLASHYSQMADYAKAEPLFEEGIAISRKHLEATAVIQTAQQQMSFEQSCRYRIDSYVNLSFASRNLPKKTVELITLQKGSIMRRLRDLRLAANDPGIAELFSNLQSITAQYSKASQQVPNPQQSSAWRERVADLKTRKESLEREMIRSSSAFAGAMKSVTLADIQESVPADSILVDYLEYNGKGGRRLLASIIRPSGESTMIDLGSAIELGKQIDLWLASHGTSAEGQAAGLAIRKQVWEPFEKHVADANFILVSPDGALGRLPLAALPGKQPGSYLIEEHPIALIPVPQLLPDLMQEQPSNAQYQLLALGDIDYDNAPTPAKLDQQPASYPDTFASPLLALRSRGQLPDMLRSSGGTWSKLAGTGPEVDYITQLYQRQHQAPNTSVVKLDETSASETAFRELAPQSRVIHVATHGFFASPDKKSALSGESIEAAAKQQMFTSIGDNQRLTVLGFSPGQLSGLVFAGANRKKSEDPLTPAPPDPSPRSGARGVDIGSDDGILTADEIAFMRLENCELVVLSACETNVGAVAGGEGILGLQRAFQQAGARSTISSLWKVDDDATKTLMQLFYTNVWTQKQSKLEALRNAQIEMLNHYNEATQKLDRSAPVEMKLVPKKDPKSTAATDGIKRLSPKYWAAFQLSGDWR